MDEPRPNEFQRPAEFQRRGRRRDNEGMQDVPRIDQSDESGSEPAPEPEPSPGRPLLDKGDLMKELEGLSNTLKARFYSSDLSLVSEVPVRDVIKSLSETSGVHAIVFDGIITQRLADLASKQGVKLLVGLKIGNVNKVPESIEIITKNK